MRLILASASPRRRELLTAAGYTFDVVPPSEDAERGLCTNCGPAELVADLASAKAADVVRQLTGVGSGQWAVGSEQEEGDRRQGTGDRDEIAATQRVAACGGGAAPCDPLGRGYPQTSTDADAARNPQSPIPNPQSQIPTIVLAADTVAECDGQILGKPRHEEHARQMLEMLSGREHRVYTGVCIWPIGQKAGNRGQETEDRGQADGNRDDVAAAQRVARCGGGATPGDPLGRGYLPMSPEASTEIPNPQSAIRDPQSPGPTTRVAVTTLRMDPLTDAQLDDYLASGGWKNKAGAFGYQDRLGWVHVIAGSESNVVGLPMELLKEMLRSIDSGERGA